MSKEVRVRTAVGTKDDPWEMALRQFAQAASRLSLKRGIREFLATTQRELAVHFPVKMDDGTVRVFTGYRVTPQRDPRPDQRRYPLPSGCHAERSARPCDVDDLEVRAGQPSLRRGQRRCGRQPEYAVLG